MLKNLWFSGFIKTRSYSCHYFELSRTKSLWKRMRGKSALERFPSWRHSSEHFPWVQKAHLLPTIHGKEDSPLIFAQRTLTIILSDKGLPSMSTASVLQKSTTLAFHPFKEFPGLVWPFCATFHSRTPAKMFSRADQRFLLLSLCWYNLTAAWHQGQLKIGNSYVTAL